MFKLPTPLPFGAESSPRFLLVNAAQVDESYWEDLHPVPIVPEESLYPASLFPVLVDNKELDDDQRAQVHERVDVVEKNLDTCFALAALDSLASPEDIAAHLARMMNVQSPKGNADILRYYDPRVFRHLQGWLFYPDQMEALLGPIKTWYWHEPDGSWKKYTSPAYADTGQRTLRLWEAQWPSLQRMVELHQVLDVLADTNAALAWKAETARQADALLGTALSAYGLRDPSDRLLFVLQALRFHPDIHRHPVLQVRLKQFAEKKISYVDECAVMDDAVMKKYASELPSRPNA